MIKFTGGGPFHYIFRSGDTNERVALERKPTMLPDFSTGTHEVTQSDTSGLKAV